MPEYDVTLTVPETILLTYTVRVNARSAAEAVKAAQQLVEEEDAPDPDEEALGRDFTKVSAQARRRP